jgi:hypothetical protein
MTGEGPEGRAPSEVLARLPIRAVILGSGHGLHIPLAKQEVVSIVEFDLEA